MHVALVIPCFNEEYHLASTCASLGFGLGSTSPPDTTLFIVDNNSTDATEAVAQQIILTSTHNTVFLGHESEQGFVPPRHHGNLMARDKAALLGMDLSDTLVLQVDADTQYAEDYIFSMKAAAQQFGPNTLIEACTAYQPTFAAAHQAYVALCAEIDAAFVSLFVPEANDVLVDDKVCGYLLRDYFNWGGHQREYTTDGEEIHAETTRLYMRGRFHGATKVIADNAFAFHSPRKLMQDPGLHLATTGFPRENSWNERWRDANDAEWKMSNFFLPAFQQNLEAAISLREQHLIALLLVLPIHVAKVLGENKSLDANNLIKNLAQTLPMRTAHDLANHPGMFMEDVFALLNQNGPLILKTARIFLAKNSS